MPSECRDGRWVYTGYDALDEVIQRPIHLPVWKFWQEPLDPYSIITDQPYSPWGNRYEGRVCVDGVCLEGRVPDEYLTNAGSTDVLHWPLYEGAPQPGLRGPGYSARFRLYDKNLAKLKDVGPNIMGALIGNCGAELAAHHWLPCATSATERQQWRLAALRFILDFIHHTGDLFASLGVTPVWAPMDREVLMDCYHWGGAMAQAIVEYGGWMIVFQEGAFFPRWTCIYGNEGQDGRHLDPHSKPGITKDGELVGPIHRHQPGYTDWDGRCVEWEARERYPYRKLLRYFWTYPVWHCIGYSPHMKAGYPSLLTLHGCKALVY